MTFWTPLHRRYETGAHDDDAWWCKRLRSGYLAIIRCRSEIIVIVLEILAATKTFQDSRLPGFYACESVDSFVRYVLRLHVDFGKSYFSQTSTRKRFFYRSNDFDLFTIICAYIYVKKWFRSKSNSRDIVKSIFELIFF